MAGRPKKESETNESVNESNETNIGQLGNDFSFQRESDDPIGDARGSSSFKSVLSQSKHNENYRALKARVVEARTNPAFTNYDNQLILPPDTDEKVFRYITVENLHELSGRLKIALMEGWMPINTEEIDPRHFTGAIEYSNALGVNAMIAQGSGSYMIAMELPRELWEERRSIYRNRDMSLKSKANEFFGGHKVIQHDTQFFRGANTAGVDDGDKPTKNLAIVD